MDFRIVASTGMMIEAEGIPCETPDATNTHLRQLVDSWERMLAAEVDLGIVEAIGDIVEVSAFEVEDPDAV